MLNDFNYVYVLVCFLQIIMYFLCVEILFLSFLKGPYFLSSFMCKRDFFMCVIPLSLFYSNKFFFEVIIFLQLNKLFLIVEKKFFPLSSSTWILFMLLHFRVIALRTQLNVPFSISVSRLSLRSACFEPTSLK